jgi:Undecaprenyl-phosphate glucose phosphotransferase
LKNIKIDILLPIVTILADIAAILGTFMVSYYLRFSDFMTGIVPALDGIPEPRKYFELALITLPVWLIVMQMNQMYKLKRSVFIFDEFSHIFRATTISILLSMGILFFIRSFTYSRIVLILIWIFAPLVIALLRYLILKLEKTFYNNGIGLKNIAVIGENDIALKIFRRFRKDKFAGFNVVGYFTKSGKPVSGIQNEFFGNYDNLPDAIHENNIQSLLISLGEDEHKDVYDLLKYCEGINIEFMLYPDFINTITGRLKVEEVDNIPFMKLKSLPMNAWNRIEKRVFDIVFSGLALILLSPVLLALALIIKLTSRGPVFYKQERVGLDNKKFQMYKFRSMVTNAEKNGPVFVSVHDDRYTKVGKFLRKYSVDELPQFINVLKGDMSVVGPRPEREFFVNQMKEKITNYLERHRVKCGITGWAQVNGYRGPTTSMQERINYDIYYIENWSLTFDIKIIVKTLKEALFSKSAL